MPAGPPLDVLIVSLGSTTGLASADEDLAESLRRAGASVAIARAQPPREVRTLMLTDLAWAAAARRAAAARPVSSPRAIVYSTTTAALLWRRPGAIRFDALAAGNRPGRHGLWQRPLERRRLAQAPLLLPLSEGALDELPAGAGVRARSLVLPLPVAASGAPAAERDIAAITYAGNPLKKGLDRVLAAWERARRARAGAPGPSEPQLLVAGATPGELRRAGIELGSVPGVRDVGRLPSGEYRALLRRSRLFLCAPRREDYGAAQMEALADGCLLVTTPAPGPYAALPLARQLDERLVDADLAAAIVAALDHRDAAGYAARARGLLAPFSVETVDGLVAERLLPALLGDRAGAA